MSGPVKDIRARTSALDTLAGGGLERREPHRMPTRGRAGTGTVGGPSQNERPPSAHLFLEAQRTASSAIIATTMATSRAVLPSLLGW